MKDEHGRQECLPHQEVFMETGWIAFMVLAAYVGGALSAMIWGSWVMRRKAGRK